MGADKTSKKSLDKKEKKAKKAVEEAPATAAAEGEKAVKQIDPSEEEMLLLPSVRNYLAESDNDKVAKAFKKEAETRYGEDTLPWDMEGMIPELKLFFPKGAEPGTILATVAAYLVAKKKGSSVFEKTIEKLSKKAGNTPSAGELGELYQAFISKPAVSESDKAAKKAKKAAKKAEKAAAVAAAAKAKATPMVIEEEILNWQPKAEHKMQEKTKEEKAEEKKKFDPIACREANRRQDWDKWAATLEGKDERLTDGFHRTGDSWGDSAFADLSKVKGKSFVKEMQKKKRASWRGGGQIDTKINSYIYPDSD